ncbi:hypothetical protein BOX15_Mlig025923g1, partial [Macrostomum lignano]
LALHLLDECDPKVRLDDARLDLVHRLRSALLAEQRKQQRHQHQQHQPLLLQLHMQQRQSADTVLDSGTTQSLLVWLECQLKQHQQLSEFRTALLQLLQAVPGDCLASCRLTAGLAQQLLLSAGLTSAAAAAEESRHRHQPDAGTAEDAQSSLTCILTLLTHTPLSAADAFCAEGILQGLIDRVRTFRDPCIGWEVKLADIDVLDRVLRAMPSLAPMVYRNLDGFVYLMEVIDLIISDCRPPRPLAQQEQALVCLVLRVLASLAASNDRDNLTPDEEAHYLRLVSLVHDLLLMPPSLDRRPLLESCLEVLLTVPLIAFEELTTPLEGTVDVACRFEDKNLSAVNSLVEFLRHCLREVTHELPPTELTPSAASSASSVGACLAVLTEASISQRSVRCFLRSLILPKHPHLPAASSSSTTSAAAAAGGGDIDTEDESITETEANSLLSDLCRLISGGGLEGVGGASASGSCGSSSGLARQAGQLLFVLCKENAAKVVRHTGLTQFPALVHSLQIPCNSTSPTASASGGSLDAYSSDSSEEEILDPEVSVAAFCSQSLAATVREKPGTDDS